MPRRRLLMPLIAVLCFATPTMQAAGSSPFAIRGIKGLWWDGIQKYRMALPWIASHGMNFMMFCYSSFPASGARWRTDYTATEQHDMGSLAIRARRYGVQLCLSFNPGLWSDPPLQYSSERDMALAIRKIRLVHRLGIDWFAICLDDINREMQPMDRERFPDIASAQIHFVNGVYAEMRRIGPGMRLIFCPSAYTSDDALRHRSYIEAVGRGLDPRILVFWTGPVVCSPTITSADARQFGAMIRRKPLLWDNYPVNDMLPWRPLLAPVRGRSADLGSAVAGYMANPMREWHASKLPLASLAEYLRSPRTYDYRVAAERAAKEWPVGDRPAIRALQALYGGAFLGEPAYPPTPVAAATTDIRRKAAELRRAQELLAARPALAPLLADVAPTLMEDLAGLERRSRNRRRSAPLIAVGDDFSGGAGKLFGYTKYKRSVNYIYAAPTGHSRMTVEFWLDGRIPSAAAVDLNARNDDAGTHPSLTITLNGAALLRGPSPFRSDRFELRSLPVPAGALRPGANVLEIRSDDPSGVVGMPPWFMVSRAELIPLHW